MSKPSDSHEPLVYIGGGLETNAYLIPGDKGWICFDAPEGLAEQARVEGWKIEALLLTHGHFDHVWDAGRIEAEHGCPVFVHAADAPLLRDISYLRMFGIQETFPLVQTLSDLPVPALGSLPWEAAGRKFMLYHIPGHSPGSVAFYEAEESRVFGGDVLFAGGVGRWDLPGGSQKTLVSGIVRHLLPLPEATTVWPGHGPGTTIGREKASNPYLPR